MDTKFLLNERLKIAAQKSLGLLNEINEIQAANQMTENEKLSRIQKIRDEIKAIADEVDNIKKEFNLLTNYRFN